MKTQIKTQLTSSILLLSFLLQIISLQFVYGYESEKIVAPLKTISKLECRFNEFDTLSSDCKEDLPILKASDYEKYAKKNGGFNKYTRLYTVLWGASYKYGWDVGHGGHMGTDIATAKGTPIYAMADGKVTIASTKVGLGKMVAIKHTIHGKTIVSNYGHMSEILVSKGDRVKAGDLIGKVGSTGNSTGNHLHFQIDVDTTFSPIYYSQKTCPYSYYQITEQGKCFDELSRITVDPLLFLETNGAVLNDVSIETKKIDAVVTVKKSSISSEKDKKIQKVESIDTDVFYKNIYTDSSNGDIRRVQQIYKALGYYNGDINARYTDVLEDIIRYQIDTGVIASRNDTGAGYFGPKTRAQTKKDYDKYIANGGKTPTVFISGNEDDEEQVQEVVTVKNRVETKKIARKNLLSREEIEAMEVKDFIQNYNIDLRFSTPGGNIGVGEYDTLFLKVTDSRGRAFEGSMPGDMTFDVDESKVDMFPKRLFFFTDGEREIKVTGLKEGTTTLRIKVGKVTVKTFTITVYDGKKTIYPDTAQIFTTGKAVLGDSQTGIGLFKQGTKKLVNIKYGSNYTLKASNGAKVCIKRGTLQTIKSTVKRKCQPEDFREQIDFDYSDTVVGLLIFDYQVLTKGASISIENTKKNLVTKNLPAALPKGMQNNYLYKNEVLAGIEKGITTSGIKRGYFMEDRALSEKDAIVWIRQSLINLKNTQNINDTAVNKNIRDLNYLESKASILETLTRRQFLELANKYLVFDSSGNSGLSYKDLDSKGNEIVNNVFTKQKTWKDRFGQTHFQPDKKITRGEGVYMLLSTLQNNQRKYLSLK